MKKVVAIIMCVLLAVPMLAGCGSDYPVIDRKLDVSGLINSFFEGTGYNVQLDKAEITVSAVADRMTIDMEKSEKTITAVQEAVRKAAPTGDGLQGTWNGKIDIGPVVCSCLKGLPNIDTSDYFHDIIIPCELSFADGGLYILRFSESSVASARKQLLAAGCDTTRGYLEANASPAVKIISGVFSDSVIEDIITYVVNFAQEMLNSGCGGYYSYNGITLSLGSAAKFSCTLKDDTLTLGTTKADGLLGCLSGAVFTR